MPNVTAHQLIDKIHKATLDLSSGKITLGAYFVVMGELCFQSETNDLDDEKETRKAS